MKKNLILTMVTASLFTFISCSEDEIATLPFLAKPQLFTSSNSSGSVSYTDLKTVSPVVKNFAIGSTDADGIFYDSTRDEVIIASRTNNRIEVYGNFKTALTANASSLVLTASSATGNFTNAREIAVSGSQIIVAQDQNVLTNGNTNKLFLFQRNGNEFILQKTFDIPFKLWGIHIDNGNLFAVADLTGDVAVFNAIASKTSGTLNPDKRVTIQGLVRTHGITIANNTMVLTDVGLATSDNDGGVIVIENFNAVFSAASNGGTIALNSQKRIYGPDSTLGNPVDVAFNEATKIIYVAERLNGGGKVLSFAYPTMPQSNASPITTRLESGVTGIFFKK